MMLATVPPWIAPTVITAGDNGLVSRETMVWMASTERAAMTMGSTVLWVCPVTAAPKDCYFKRVGRSAEESSVKANLPGREGRLVMNPNDNVRLRELCK